MTATLEMRPDLVKSRRGRTVVEHPTASDPPTRSKREGAVVDSIPTPEIWKPIPGYEGAYEVSDQGRVRSLDRTVYRKDGRVQHLLGRVLRSSRSGKYRSIALCVETCQKNVNIHQLVMLAFRGPTPAGMEILHFDDCGGNNSLANLRFGTSSDNTQDLIRNGNHHELKKTHCAHGHEYSLANTYRPPSGQRVCRICMARYKVTYRAKKAAA